jgi:hypothetical protein
MICADIVIGKLDKFLDAPQHAFQQYFAAMKNEDGILHWNCTAFQVRVDASQSPWIGDIVGDQPATPPVRVHGSSCHTPDNRA